MANKFNNFHIFDIYDMVKVNRTVKFLVIMGIIIFIDTVIDMTSFFNKLMQITVYNIFSLKIDNIGIYTSLYASIAVLLSSDITIIEKLGYSIGLLIIYIIMFTFIAAYDILCSSCSLYLTLIVFITITFPMLLWIVLDSEGNKKIVRYGLEDGEK